MKDMGLGNVSDGCGMQVDDASLTVLTGISFSSGAVHNPFSFSVNIFSIQ